MRKRTYRLLRNVLHDFEISQREIAEMLGMCETSLSSRMTGKLSWDQDEMYAICNYVNAKADYEGEPPPMPYERLHEYFPPRVQITLKQKSKKGA